MNNQFKPTGYNLVSPYLMVDDAQKFIDMLLQIFDAKEKRKFAHPGGAILHAEVQIDDSVIMVSQANEKYPAYHFWMHFYVPDVDETFDRAIEYGCEIVEKPTVKEGDPDRRGTFMDFAGNYWAVGTQQ
ncbi:MAG: VOC family protein [Ginsengibacter sp.]